MLFAFGVALFSAASLLFAVQPLMSKVLLPLFGGSALVWAAALVFFQAGLLVGYAYAFACSRLTLRRQVINQAALVLLPIITLPLTVRAGDLPTSVAPPAAVFGILALSIGLPYVALASTSPLLQHWFSRTTHRAAADPYFLYAAGNAGSLLGLLAYPFVFEPLMPVGTQQLLWSASYVAFALLTMGTGWLALRRQRVVEPLAGEAPAVVIADDAAEPPAGKRPGVREANTTLPRTAAPTPARRARWIVLAFVPAAMLTAVTTYVTSDIAAVPLLWVIPLALYLLAFIVAYGRRRFIAPSTAGTILAVLSVAVIISALGLVTLPLWGLLALQYGLFFAAALLAAMLLADDRPGTTALTVYYLLMALGGVLGGAFSGLVAPLVFNTTLEYPIGLLLAIALIPPARSSGKDERAVLRDVTVGLALFLGLLVLLTGLSVVGVQAAGLQLVLAGLAVTALLLRRRPVRLAFALGSILAITLLAGQSPLYADRTFYGVHRVVQEEARHVYVSGTTVHGAQEMIPGGSRRPLSYYHPDGPIGAVFEMLRGRSQPIVSVGLVGLGTGALAAYAEAGERWRFYEIDPVMIEIATADELFTYLAEAHASVETVEGDGRLGLAEEPTSTLDVIVIDAFTGDAVPAHLLTQEALMIYLDKLRPGGVLVFNTSNRFVDVSRVVAGAAEELGLSGVIRGDDRAAADETPGRAPSEWLVVAREADDLGSLPDRPGWRPLTELDPVLWTDDYSDLVRVLRWQ